MNLNQKYIKILILNLIFLSLFSCEFIPKISIITSIYNGERFIEQFLEDITRQTIFNKCELIVINANSQQNEEKFINTYLQKYKNIIYIKLDKKITLYAAWNKAISLAKGMYLTNANVDDRLLPICYEVHSKELDNNQNIALVYSDAYETKIPNQLFENSNPSNIIFKPAFSKINLKKNCLPSFNPMWRKSLHQKYGVFDEKFIIAGDWEFWLRIASRGETLKKINGIYGIFFRHNQALSSINKKLLLAENKIIMERYKNFK